MWIVQNQGLKLVMGEKIVEILSPNSAFAFFPNHWQIDKWELNKLFRDRAIKFGEYFLERCKRFNLNPVELEFLGSGRHRSTFLLPSRKNVIKFPLTDRGFAANLKEASRDNWPWPVARCKLLQDLLIMEYIDLDFKGNKPLWAEEIDCYQVGINKFGQYVAYDYAG